MSNQTEGPAGDLQSTFVVFDPAHHADAVAYTSTFWDHLSDRFGDFSGHILVSSFRFDADWDNWELHPRGDELIFLLEGAVDFLLDRGGSRWSVSLDRPGAFLIVPRATWHTAKVRSPSVALFVTPGEGTRRRPVIAAGPDAQAPPVPTADCEPIMNQINVIARDFDAAIAFYRRLGVAIVESPRGADGIRHAKAVFPGGVALEFDNERLAGMYHAAWRRHAGPRVLIGFTLPTRDAVDRLYRELVAAGCPGRQPPYDAFWGQRYAIVGDPDGNDVELLSPLDDSRRTWPPSRSPDP